MMPRPQCARPASSRSLPSGAPRPAGGRADAAGGLAVHLDRELGLRVPTPGCARSSARHRRTCRMREVVPHVEPDLPAVGVARERGRVVRAASSGSGSRPARAPSAKLLLRRRGGRAGRTRGRASWRTGRRRTARRSSARTAADLEREPGHDRARWPTTIADEHRREEQLGGDDVEHVGADLIALLATLERQPAGGTMAAGAEPAIEQLARRRSWGTGAAPRARRAGRRDRGDRSMDMGGNLRRDGTGTGGNGVTRLSRPTCERDSSS